MIPKKTFICLSIAALTSGIQANPAQDPPTKKFEKSNFPPLYEVGFITLDQIRFPDNLDGIEAPTLMKGMSIHPDETGFPKVDLDGHWQTEDDILPVEDTDSGFIINWEDQYKPKGAWLIIERNWVVTNLFTMNRMEHTQIIKTPFDPSMVASRD
jgi:hypothetical protein